VKNIFYKTAKSINVIYTYIKISWLMQFISIEKHSPKCPSCWTLRFYFRPM